MNKRTKIIEQQRHLLIDFLRKNPRLIRGKFSSTFTRLDAKRKWIQLRDILNSVLGGSHKKWRCWRRTWQDMRSRTKIKIAKIRHASAIGRNLDMIPKLAQWERAVMALISPGAVKDISEVEEPSTNILPKPMTYSPTIPVIESVKGCSRDYPELPLSYYRDNKSVELAVPPQNIPNVTPPATILDETQIKLEEEQFKLEEEQDASETVPKPAKEMMKQRRVLASEKLLECLTTSLDIKEKYYEEKIALLRRDVAAKEKIAKSLAIIAADVSGRFNNK